MRTISAGLLAAQNAASNVPYIYLLFTSADGGTTYNYSSDQAGRRILFLDHNEEAYNDYANVILRNEDNSIPNLKGYWVEIGHGYVVSGTPEYSQTARLWVKHQQKISAQGKRVVLLELEGTWAKLRELYAAIGSAPFYQDEDGTLAGDGITVYDALGVILGEAGMTLNALAEDDSIMDTLEPNFGVNNQIFETLAGLAYRLISMTKSYLRTKKTLAFEVKYPQDSDSIDITYYSNQAPYFREYMERENTLVPNHILVFANAGEDGLFLDRVTGEASDANEIAALYDITLPIIAGELTTEADADARAEAILARAKMEMLAGRMVAPHDCRVELYDNISVYDNRSL